MRQICNFAYALLVKDRTPPQIAELEVLLAEPTMKEEMIDKQNAEAMAGLGGFGMIAPRPPRARPKKGEG